MAKQPKIKTNFAQDYNQEDNKHQQEQDPSEEEEEEQESSSQQSQDQSAQEAMQERDYDALQDLIKDLNDDDHSEDQGIQDYKVGGYHPCHIGQVLMNRYVLIQKLGWGHFSTVWLAKDFKFSTYVAVKIMKSAPHYLQASYDQIQILQNVAKKALDPQWIESLKKYQPNKTKFDRDDCHVLNLLNAFLYKGPYGNHFCMVFQILGINLWQVLKKYDCKGLPINSVKQITRQILMGLDFLNRICRVIHTDLKPENVLLCLTDQQLKKIVEDSQLASAGDYEQRLKVYRNKFNLGPKTVENQQQKNKKQQIQSSQQQYKSSRLLQIQQKIQQIKGKLQSPQSSTNKKKTLRKKLKKWEQQKIKQLQQIKHIQQFMKKQKLQKDKKKNKKKQKSFFQLFSNFKNKISFDNTSQGLPKDLKVKIADLGNACWQHHHFATEIQTRQYRGPQVLLGSKYNISADMWSLACMTFELLTGELLFNPKKDPDQKFGKNDEHLAQMMQLLGRFPKKMSYRGTKNKKYISKQGSLRRISKLQNWSLKDVMIAKYKFKEQQAEIFQDFMLPMLNCYPQKRTLSHVMLNHPWIHTPIDGQYLMDNQTHLKIRKERYEVDKQKDEVFQYESQKQDADSQDSDTKGQQQDLYEIQKVGDIKMIDRSFTDLGYIGYGTGIYLQKLDFGPNWQFS